MMGHNIYYKMKCYDYDERSSTNTRTCTSGKTCTQNQTVSESRAVREDQGHINIVVYSTTDAGPNAAMVQRKKSLIGLGKASKEGGTDLGLER